MDEPKSAATGRLSWQVTIVLVSLIVGAVVLGAMGRPLTDLLALAGIILGGGGLVAALGGGGVALGEVRAIRQQTNGTQSELVAAVRSLAYQLAAGGPRNGAQAALPTPADDQAPEIARES